MVTRPVRLAGKVLHLNARADSGEIAVEVLDAAGARIARSRPIRQDALDIPVDWEEGGVEGLAAPVALRFRLVNACLYAVWCS